MSATNRIDLHPNPFWITYKSWGRVIHMLNFNDDAAKVRLEVIEGEDKGSSFVVDRAVMQAAIKEGSEDAQ